MSLPIVNRSRWLIAAFLALLAALGSLPDAAGALSTELPPQVVLESGTLRGFYRETQSGRNVASFMGIPYAKPPLGKHRFKEPVPMGPWIGVYNATSRPNLCLQYTHLGFEVTGSEDCLYLNVFTPRIPTGTAADPLMDVIVHIHGGAFMFFSSGYFGPKYLLDKDVVLVTISYRLGPLGFFSTGDELVSGNLGMKDQVLALKWIQNNIAAFGGNPNSVTITGMSAGGASIHYHMLSPLSRGLFHKAISMSGVSFNPWAFAENITEKSMALAASLGCAFMDSHLMLKCLRTRPAERIVEFAKQQQSWRYNPISPWAPTVEPPTPTAFLSESPIDIIANGKAADVPWLSSFCSLEGLYPAADFIYDKKEMETLEAQWESILPDLLEMSHTAPKERMTEITRQIKDFYLQGKPANDPSSVGPLVKMIGDRLFYYGIATATQLHAKTYKSPIYSYKFSHEGSDSIAHSICHCKEKLNGACHGDDLGYVIDTLSPTLESSADLQLSSKMVNLWTTFANKGVAEWNGVAWPSLQDASPDYILLEIGQNGNAQLITEQDAGNGNFWKSLNLNENVPNTVLKDEL